MRRRVNGWMGVALLGAAGLSAAVGCQRVSDLVAPTTGTLTLDPMVELRDAVQGDDDHMAAQTLKFPQVIYAAHDRASATFVLLDGAIDAPRRAAIIELMWRPQGGQTPVSPTATNATLTLMDYTQGDEPRVYRGAGFLLPSAAPGPERLKAKLRDMEVSNAPFQAERAEGEALPETPPLFELTGTLRAMRDDETANAQARQLRDALPR